MSPKSLSRKYFYPSIHATQLGACETFVGGQRRLAHAHREYEARPPPPRETIPMGKGGKMVGSEGIEPPTLSV